MMKNLFPNRPAGELPEARVVNRAESAKLVASECRYRRLFESAKDGILILDAESGMVLDVNPYLIELLGYSHEQFVGKAIWDLGFFRDAIANRENFLELQEKGYIRYEDLPLETEDGRHVNVEFVSNVYPEGEKNVIQCNIRDITARKHSENFHDMNRECLRILNAPGDLHASITSILSMLKTKSGFDAVGMRLQDGDDYPYCGQLGFSENFLSTENTLVERGADGGVCRDGEGNICLECTCGLVISGKTGPSNPLFTPGGSFWTNDAGLLLKLPTDEDPRLHSRNECIHQGYASMALVPIRNQTHIVGLIHFSDGRKNLLNDEMVERLEDMATHLGEALIRKQTEADLRASHQLIDKIINTIPVRVFWKDRNLVYLGCNTAFARDAGFATPKDIIGKDDYQMAWRDQAELYRADDRTVIESGNKTENKEEPQTTPAGNTITLLTSKTPLRNSTGKITGILGTYVDITKQRQMESQFRQAQKMESVGRLAGGVAHDFNNMLSIILGHVGLALDRVPSNDPLFENLFEIQGAANRSAGLTQQLLAFARKQDVEPHILNLNEKVTGTLTMLQKLIGEDVDLIWKPGGALHAIKIDPSQIDQILINLCVNARDAIDNTGTISMETGNFTVDADYCAAHAEAVPGTYVFLAVSDTGCGIDKEALEHIFEPFYTTKEVSKGTGLGLATIYGIVKQNNGFVYAYSEPGLGTTFRIYLPQAERKAEVKKAPAPTSRPQGQGETILLVEDNPALQKVYKQFIGGLDYTLLAAQTPDEALRLSALHPDIHLMLTDVVMPGMNGRQLAEKIRASNPAIRVLFMSGYTADILAERGVHESHVDFIGKPFSRDALADKLRAMLES